MSELFLMMCGVYFILYLIKISVID